MGWTSAYPDILHGVLTIIRTIALVSVLATTAVAASAAPVDINRVEDGALVFENIPPLDPQRIARLQQYLAYRSAVFVDWSPDGGILIMTRFGDTTQLFLVEEPMGARHQLTFFDEPVIGGPFSPTNAPDAFVFAKDHRGDEAYQLYLYDLDNRSIHLLTDGRSRNTSPVWSNHGTQLAFSSNRRDPDEADVYVAYPFENRGPRALIVTSGALAPLDYSPNDSRLLLLNYISYHESNLFLVNRSGGGLYPVGPDEVVAYGDARFTKDGRALLLTTDYLHEHLTLGTLEPRSGRINFLTGDVPWDITRFDESPDGRYIAFVANENGSGSLYIQDRSKERFVKLPEIPAGQIYEIGFDRSGRQLAFTLETATSPSDVYSIDLKTNRLIRWTRSEIGGIDPRGFVEPQLIHYTSFDGLEIPAFVYEPSTPGPHPVLIHIHGGPELQFKPDFDARYQYYVNELGLAVIAPNVRGSTGYGKTYLGLDNGSLREDAVKDIGALLDWIDTQTDLDGDRVVVEGASYGGYMVLATLVHFGDRLLGGIDFMGISNFVNFLENTEAHRQPLRREEYGDENDPQVRAFLQRISPANNTDKIKRPMLVVQGLNDPRVPITESTQLVETLRASGNDIWYLLAKNEGHGFTRRRNREAYLAATIAFLEYLQATSD